MRTVINFNSKWAFTKQATEIPAAMPKDWNFVNVENFPLGIMLVLNFKYK